MRRSLLGLAAAALTLGAAGAADAAEPTPFALMKRYCVDTDADPTKVEAAILADGFAIVGTDTRPDGASDQRSFAKIAGENEYFVVTERKLEAASADIPASLELTCTFAMSRPDRAALVEAKLWLPEAKVLEGEGMLAIPYRRTAAGFARLDPYDRAAVRAAIQAGEMSLISASTLNDMTMFNMTRTKATP